MLCRLLWLPRGSPALTIHWSGWRRRHQARAMQCHYRRRPSDTFITSATVVLGLRETELTGEIPHELRNIDDLLALYLSGNQFSGCVPVGLRDIRTHDLEQLGLLFCEDIDRDALVALYDSTGGYRWRFHTTGSATLPSATWHGVYTDENGRCHGGAPGRQPVDRYPTRRTGRSFRADRPALWDNRLSGPIPLELGNLSNLTELFLDDNWLSGRIPAELGQLSNLAELTLNDNNLRGPIQPELGGLHNLYRNGPRRNHPASLTASLLSCALCPPTTSTRSTSPTASGRALHPNRLSGAYE